jgi:hypothetical protein
MCVMVASPARFHLSGKLRGGDHHDVWVVAHELRRRGGTDAQVSRATRQINITDRDARPWR